MKFTSASTTTIFIFFSAAAAPSALADVIERNIIPVSDEQGPRRDPVSHHVDLGTRKVRGSNENVAPDLLGAVQIVSSSAPGSSICTRSPDYSCYKTGRPECCSYNDGLNCPSYNTMCNIYAGEEFTGPFYCCSHDGGRNCPNYNAMCINYPGPQGYVWWNYCTYQPDYNCYPNGGRPSCCSMSGGGTMNCPIKQPSCENSRFLRGIRNANN